MSQDLQFIGYEGSAKLRSVDLVSSSSVPVLDLRGENFVDVARVKINGAPSPEFIVLSKTRLLAQVPAAQVGGPVREVVVLTTRAELTASAAISLDIGVGAKLAEGKVRLVQRFLKVLLQTPGSDIFRPSVGGGLQRLLGATTPTGGAALKATASRAVTSTQVQLVADQAGRPELEDAERLGAATLLGIDFDPATTMFSLRVRLKSLDGETADAGISL